MATTEEQLLQTLRADLDATELKEPPDDTIRPDSNLAELPPDPTLALRPGIDLGDIIGRGGMGVVYAAREETLGRTIAVKTLHPHSRELRAARKLRQEAWVTGRLDHPNVIPVHRIDTENDGTPRVVLKRVDGDTWASLMHDPVIIEQRFRASDALAWNLGVLLSVSNAVRFAHDRGIIHRDIKPENVMVGSYGEVYLVDWGLAVAVDDRASVVLPRATDVTQMAGTLSYMAPEQFFVIAQDLGVRTDLYLLGATLYEVVTGKPPHKERAIGALATSINASKPVFPPGVPEPLCEIVRRAMQRQPADRYPDVASFSKDLADFLDRRSVLQLVDGASRDLAALRSLLSDARESGEPDLTAAYRLFGASRFGFRQALAMWPACTTARSGMGDATRAMVEAELQRGEPEAAAVLLTELETPPKDLADRVELARAEHSRARERLAQLERYMDPRRGRRARTIVMASLSAVWVLMPSGLHLLRSLSGAQRSHQGALIGALALLAIVSALLIYAYRSILATAVNRALGAGALLAVLAQVIMHTGALLSHASLHEPLRAQYLPWFAICGILTFVVDRWFAVPTIVYAGAVVVTALRPDEAYLVTTIANVVLAAVYWNWWWRLERLPAPGEESTTK